MLKPSISLFFSLALTALQVSVASAGTILVPTDPIAKRPPADLVRNGRVLDVTEATELARSGFPLDTLQPRESILWTEGNPPRLSPELDHFPPSSALVIPTVAFDSVLASPRGLFRAAIDYRNPLNDEIQPYTLTVALDYASAVVRASIMRKMGYLVVNPKVYPKLKVTFPSIPARDEFLEKLADRTLTSRNRWIESAPANQPFATLKQVVLEPGRVRVQTLHWGLISQDLQRDRRVFRALLIPYLLTEIPEKVNQYAWGVGREFSEGIWLEYLYADSFPDVSIADLKWAVRQLGKISRADLAAAVADAGLPNDLTALISERLVSRRNSLMDVFRLNREFPAYAVDQQVTIGHVSGGQLQDHTYDEYPQEFYEAAALAPMRFSQLWRYFLVQGISTGLGQGLSQVNSRLLTIQNESNAISRHNQAVQDGLAHYIFQTGAVDGYQNTTGLWGAPLFGINVNAQRSVVAGTILGSDSQVQLVDTLSAEVNAGYYLGFDRAEGVLPGISSTVKLGRSYSHIRPIGDMRDGLRTNWGHLAVTAFMAKLGNALDPDIQCTIPEEAHRTEFELDGQTYYKVKYDRTRDHGEEEARTLRQQMISEGIAADRIVLEPIDRAANCQTEVDDAVKQNLEEFMEGLAVGESFLITDYIKFGAEASVRYTIPIWSILRLNLRGSVGEEFQIARATIIRKTADGFQISLQDRRVDDLNFNFDLRFFLNVAGVTRTRRHGHGTTDFYSIRTEGADTQTRRNLIRALHGLLIGNSAEVLTDHFHPYTMDHDMRTRISRFRLLQWTRNVQRQEHEADIYPPYDPDHRYDREAMKRTVYMRRNVYRNGSNLVGLVTGILSNGSGGGTGGNSDSSALGNLGSNDPGNSIGGGSHLEAVSVQAEVTPNRAFRPVALVEQTFRGWKLKKDALFELMDEIEGEFSTIRADHALFHREQFANTNSLQLYQVEANLLLYPEALQQLSDFLISPQRSNREVFSWLAQHYGWEKLRFYCAVEATRRMPMPNLWYGDPTGRVCTPPWMGIILNLKRQGLSSDPREKVGQLQLLMQTLIGNIKASQFLNEISRQNYFFSTRISGFRSGDANGIIDFTSDTVGQFDNELGMGIYRDLSTSTGISPFEIYGRFFTDGM